MKKTKSFRIKNPRPKQLSFFKPNRKFHGGALLLGRRKSLRPLSSKDAIHFVMRSEWAKGVDSFLASRNRKAVERIIARFAKKFGVRIYRQSINSNHLHLLLRISNRVLYRAFIKAVSGKIASHIMGEQSFKLFMNARSQRNNKLNNSPTEKDAGGGAQTTEKKQGFWQFRPFSRVVNWGADFKTCSRYLTQNILEALGFVPYKRRKNYYAKWLHTTVSDINNYVATICKAKVS